MPAQRRIFTFFLVFLIALVFFSFLSKKTLGQVFINELLPNPSSPPDWVELYNTGNEVISLEGWFLKDSTSVMLTIHEATISAHGFIALDVGKRLNQSSDVVSLFDQSSEEKDRYEYTSNPGTDVSFGRMSDGENWAICLTLTKEGPNSCVSPTSTPTPTVTPGQQETPTPTPTAAPTQAPTPTPTAKPTPIKKVSPTPTIMESDLSFDEATESSFGDVLGIESTPSASPTSGLESGSFNFRAWLPRILIGGGFLLLAVSGGYLLLPKIRGYNGGKDE